MDDILDPADHEELARKIEASPFATELIHRSRDAIRRLRLSAPEVLAGDEGDLHGGQSNMDANTAAEYLDSLLSPEEVADFERSCLEAGPHADMLLAEAVSCHHILTLVLGEPAEVDADLRQRMYALADEPAPAAAQTLRIEPGHTPPAEELAIAAPVEVRRARLEPDESAVPDYILEAARVRRQRQRLVLSFVAAAVIGGLGVWLFWPQGEVKLPEEVAQSGAGDVERLSGADGLELGDGVAEGLAATPSDESPADGAATADTEAPPFVATPPAAAPADEGPTIDSPPVDAPSVDVPTETAPVAATTAGPLFGDAAGAIASEVDPAAPAPVDPVAPAPVDATPALPPAGGAVDDAIDLDTEFADSVPAAPAAGGEDATANVDASRTPPQLPPQTPPQPPAPEPDALAADVDDVPSAPTPGPATSAPAVVPEGPRQLGAYLGNNDLLLRYDEASQGWIRLPPRSALASSDRLLALPNFRTHVVLNDVNVYLGGGTEIDLLAPEAGGGPSPSGINITIPYGRLIINSGLNGNRIRLTTGDHARELDLGPSSNLAVEVVREFVPGADPEREPAPIEVSWYLTIGTATPVDGLEGSEVEGPAMWRTIDGEDQPPQAINELPEWIDREPISDSQRRALAPVSEALAAGSPVSLRLAELSDPNSLGRRIEVRSLAAEAGAYAGQYDSLVKTLSDVNQKAAWKARIEALRGAIAREGAPAVEGIREALAVQHGANDADDLVEMLIGFSPEDVGRTRAEVENGALVRLLRWLESDDLAHRVLALHNINAITGTSGLGGFRPEHTAEQRRRAMKYYSDRWDKGELMPKP